MGADGDDELGALVVGEQHRDVLAGAGGREDDRVDAERRDPREARGAAVAVGVHDDLGAAAQGRVGDRVHVADDEVGLVAGLEERVGAAVDADEDRAVLADVAAAASRGPPCSGSRARR